MFVEMLPDDVTWFSSSQQGAPQMMGGTNGGMLEVLDACLINGYNELTVVSITKDNDYLTLNYGAAHGYLEKQFITIAGAEDPLLNGKHRVYSLTVNTITLYTPAVTSILGTIISKVAPLGWESIFGSDTPLKRAYRSTSSKSGKRVIYLDMDYPAAAGYHATQPARRAMVSVCQDMQVIGEQIGPLTSTVNNMAINPNGSLFWYQKRDYQKTGLVPNTPSKWRIVGNGEFFYFVVGWYANAALDNTYYSDVFGFGEFIGFQEGGSQDKTMVIASLNPNDAPTFNMGSTAALLQSRDDTAMGIFIMQGAQMERVNLSVYQLPDTSQVISGGGYFAYPSPLGSAIFTQPLRIGKSSANFVHGVMPTMMLIESSLTTDIYEGTIIDGLLILLVIRQPTTAKAIGYYGFYLGE